jgi:hypothetical protein
VPCAGANPAIGTVSQLEFVDEDRVEVRINDSGPENVYLKSAIEELKRVSAACRRSLKGHSTRSAARFTHTKKSRMMSIGWKNFRVVQPGKQLQLRAYIFVYPR